MSEDRPIADFVVEKPGLGVRLLVEARNVPAPSREWAARFLRNIFEHDEIPQPEYFLMALRNHFYLWHRPAREPGNPDFEADTASELSPYLSRLKYPLDTLYKSSFDMLIQAWLGELVDGTLPESEWLVESGLAAAVRDGSIRLNLAA
ncbi:MAG TPA: hypothetical protein VHX14_13125 [Thermoanaerobaculia bacterium]|jgi:hypothetical protein|nr:hypothetical protein [Thermoanaerobaculia bacterium]